MPESCQKFRESVDWKYPCGGASESNHLAEFLGGSRVVMVVVYHCFEIYAGIIGTYKPYLFLLPTV